MPTHHLYLTNSVMVCLVSGRSGFAQRREFPVSDEGVSAFEGYLRDHAQLPTRIYTDLGEEDLRADTIPHVGRADRDVILARKLGQIFRNAPFRHALVQGRETEGRRDDRV